MNTIFSRLLMMIGLVLLSIGILVNEFTLLWASGREPGGIHPGTVSNIRIFQGLLIIAGVAVLARGRLRQWWERWRKSAPAQWLKPRFERWTVVALIPIALLSLGFQVIGCQREGLALWSPVVASSMLESAMISCMVVLLVSACAVRVFRRRFPIFLVTAAWGIAFFAEVLIVIYGGDRFEPAMLGYISPEGLGNYISIPTVCGFITANGLVFTGAWLLQRRSVGAATWASIGRLATWLGFIVALQPSFLVFRALSLPLDYFQRSKTISQRELVRRYAPDPVIRAIKFILIPSEFQVTSDISANREIIEHLRLPMLDPQPPALELGPFRRVILILCESLSLPCISRYNPRLPGQLTPVLDGLPLSSSRFRTCSIMSGPGLASHVCSHPNHRLIRARRYPSSFVNILRKHGWQTVLFNSSSRYFDSSYRRLAEIGYNEQYHREWQMESPENRPYIQGWGVCDRLTLSSAADYLKRHRSEKVFLSVLTIDTHPPKGRSDYGDLAYPPEPPWISGLPRSAPMLRALFRFDHDLGLFLDTLRQEALLDEECLVIISADHCMPASPQYLAIPGTNDSPYESIPFIVLSGRELPKLDPKREASQVSTAPTILHLLGIPAPVGWWGRSLYDYSHPSPIFVASYGVSRSLQVGAPGQQGPAVDPKAARAFFNTLLNEPKRSNGER